MTNYYSDLLNSNKLRRCYEIAPIRVRQFLEAEIDFVLNKINQNDVVLDLGCGYGRVAIRLLKESIRVTRKGGTVLFSTYSEKFWDNRLKWFQIQAEHGLIGEIDYRQTKNGVIICRDGFKAITYSGQELLELASNFNVQTTIHEIDNSSVFCEMVVS